VSMRRPTLHELLAADHRPAQRKRCACQTPAVPCAGWNGTVTTNVCLLDEEATKTSAEGDAGLAETQLELLGQCTCFDGPRRTVAAGGDMALWMPFVISGVALLLLLGTARAMMRARSRAGRAGVSHGWVGFVDTRAGEPLHLREGLATCSSSRHALPLPIRLASGARALGTRIQGVTIEIPELSLSQAERLSEGPDGPSCTERSDRTSERSTPWAELPRSSERERRSESARSDTARSGGTERSTEVDGGGGVGCGVPGDTPRARSPRSRNAAVTNHDRPGGARRSPGGGAGAAASPQADERASHQVL
jgi:hypothetical protein